jgi:hypothetical protein
MEIIQEKYRKLVYEPSLELLSIIWFENSFSMTEDEYISISHTTPIIAENFKAKRILMDTKDFKFVVVPEIQDALNKEVIPHYLKLGIERFAFVVPLDIFVQVALQQAIDDSTDIVKQRIKYFDDQDIARKWLIR